MHDNACGNKSRIVLVDNGSLNPESVLEARTLATSLSERIGKSVDLVSVAHSDSIPKVALGDVPAVLWKRYWKEARENEVGELIAVPLFIGPAFALKKAKLQTLDHSDSPKPMVVRWADSLVTRTNKDAILIEILAENAIQVLGTDNNRQAQTSILLVDHGSPFEDVTACRDYAANELRESLGDRVSSVVACSMERRDGEAFDFNEPSLADALDAARSSGVERVVISYLFLFSGRHAGPGGDIDRICERSDWKVGQELVKTALLGSHPKILDLLELRLNSIHS